MTVAQSNTTPALSAAEKVVAEACYASLVDLSQNVTHLCELLSMAREEGELVIQPRLWALLEAAEDRGDDLSVIIEKLETLKLDAERGEPDHG